MLKVTAGVEGDLLLGAGPSLQLTYGEERASRFIGLGFRAFKVPGGDSQVEALLAGDLFHNYASGHVRLGLELDLSTGFIVDPKGLSPIVHIGAGPHIDFGNQRLKIGLEPLHIRVGGAGFGLDLLIETALTASFRLR